MNIYDNDEIVKLAKSAPEPKKSRHNVLIITAIVLSALCLILSCAALIVAITKTALHPPPISQPPDYEPTKALTAAVLPSVVEVDAGSMKGSGVVISIADQKYIVTNHHVIKNSSATKVRFYGVLDFSAVSILGYDAYHDIALLKATAYPDTVTVAKMDTSGYVNPGQFILAVGNALGLGTSVFDGIVSSNSNMIEINNDSKSVPVYQVTSPINAGMSGGGLFDKWGKLIGINTYQHNYTDNNRPVDGMSYSVPMSIAFEVIKQIIAEYQGEPLQIQKINVSASAALAEEINFGELNFRARYRGKGLTVTQSTSSTEMLGGTVEMGDVITKIGDLDVDIFTGFPPLFAQCLKYVHNSDSTGEQLKITLLRGEKTITVTYDNKKQKA